MIRAGGRVSRPPAGFQRFDNDGIMDPWHQIGWCHDARGVHVTWIDEREAQEPEKIRAALADYARRRETPQLSRVAQYDGGDERFGLWLALVDARIVRRVGIGLFDLADWNMRDAYESGSSPRDAAQEALESDDLYASFVGGGE